MNECESCKASRVVHNTTAGIYLNTLGTDLVRLDISDSEESRYTGP